MRTVRVVLGAAVALALLVPVTPLAGSADPSAGGATISGRVDDEGRGVAGVPVGYSDAASTATVRTRTSADGRFTLQVPTGARPGFVWAGLDLRAQRVVFSVHRTDYVRAVVGGSRSQGALFQTRSAAAPARIAGGHPVAIHLRHAARLAGSNGSLARFRLVLRRGDGTLVTTLTASAAGTYRSAALAPGRYRLLLRPPGSSAATGTGTVGLRAGRSTAVAPGRAAAVRRGESVLRGTVRAPKDVASVAVRVEVRREDRLVTTVRADAHGRYRIRGLASGRYTLIAGRNTPHGDDDSPRLAPTRDDTVAAAATVTLHRGRTTTHDLRLGSAGHVRGTTPVRQGNALVEDATGRLVRVARIGTDGTFHAGGLRTGDYRVIVSDGASFETESVHVVAGRTTDAGRIAPARPLPVLRGAVTVPTLTAGERVNVDGAIVGATEGYDTMDVVDGASGDVPDDGRFTLHEVLPGLHRFVASTYLGVGRNAQSRSSARGAARLIDVTVDTPPLTLDVGPRNGAVAGTFVSRGGPGAGYLPAAPVSARGERLLTTGNTVDGTFELTGPAGVYRWGPPFGDVAPASDGPWWAHPVSRTVTVPDGIDRTVEIRLDYHP